MNSSLSLLHPYPFEKLNQLFKDITPANLPLIPLSIGEPKHPAPEFVKQAIIATNPKKLIGFSILKFF